MTRADLATAAGLALAAFLVFNANGREVGTYDSQPTKFAARDLLLHGSLSLDPVIEQVPELAARPGFQLARDGRYRLAYSPVPALAAATVAWPLWKTGALDIRGPLGPNVIAAFAASLLSALSAALVYLTGRAALGRPGAALLAVGFAFGTGMWPTVSQTLWQHETAIFGLALAVLAFTRPAIGPGGALLIGIGLALAGTSRMQLAPAVAVVAAGVFVRAGWRNGVITSAVVAAGAGAVAWANTRWFGTPLGAAPMLEALHDTVHGVSSSFTIGPAGFAGLLVSPSRGLLVYSPIVGVAFWSARAIAREGWRDPLRWCLVAAVLQYASYASYSVWWAGHTYGPRYMLDLLPLIAPLAAAGMARLEGRVARGVAVAALAWSIVVAATGAFVFPNERWNTDPANVDLNHARLWDWSDPQIVRCWQTNPSPQNFSLFVRAAWRVDP